MTKFFLLIAAAAAVAVPAAAEPVESVRVAIADLDLTSAAGQRALDTRINRAVIELCGAAADVDLAGRNAVRACRATALGDAERLRNQRIAAHSTDAIQLAAR